MTSSFSKSPDGTVVITLSFPWPDLQAAYEKVVAQAVSDTELPGFRKGKAPRDLVEPKLNRTDSLSHAFQELLPGAYQQAVQDHLLKPILYPKLQITSALEGSDWLVTATTCEAPQITLPDYKKDLAKSAKDLSDVLDYLLKNTQVALPQLLISEETNHRLAGLAENLTGLGMTTQTYLANKKLTLETLQSQYLQLSKNDLTIEFSLASIQSAEKLADRQKTLDFLTSLV
jgi:FKBP-type peptidyl-prolyl cis-trans isomerase (trigger factor)